MEVNPKNALTKIELSIADDVNFQFEPEVKSFTKRSQDYIFVKVIAKDSKTSDGKLYATGLFTDNSYLSINLDENHFYDFTVVSIRDYFEHGYKSSLTVTNAFEYDNPIVPTELDDKVMAFDQGKAKIIDCDVLFGHMQNYKKDSKCYMILRHIGTRLGFKTDDAPVGTLRISGYGDSTIDIANTRDFYDIYISDASAVNVKANSIRSSIKRPFIIGFTDTNNIYKECYKESEHEYKSGYAIRYLLYF